MYLLAVDRGSRVNAMQLLARGQSGLSVVEIISVEFVFNYTYTGMVSLNNN